MLFVLLSDSLSLLLCLSFSVSPSLSLLLCLSFSVSPSLSLLLCLSFSVSPSLFLLCFDSLLVFVCFADVALLSLEHICCGFLVFIDSSAFALIFLSFVCFLLSRCLGVFGKFVFVFF